MNRPMEMILVLGLPGAGKSSYVQGAAVRRTSASEVVCFDELRKAFGHKYHPATEQMVNAVGCIMARLAFMRGHDVMIDESITTPGLAMDLVGVAREFNAQVFIRHICTPVDICRAARVPHIVPVADFDRKLAEWQMWGKHILSMGDGVHHIDVSINSDAPCPGGLVSWGASCDPE